MIPTKQRPQPQPQPQAPQPEMPEDAPRHNRIWLYAAIAIAAAVIGGGIVYLLTSKSKSEEKRAQEIYEELAELEQIDCEEFLSEQEDCVIDTNDEEEIIDTKYSAKSEEKEIVDDDLKEEIIDINTIPEEEETPPDEYTPVYEDSKVFTSVEQMPEFPGGQAALMSWLANHIKYPAMAQENGVQGRVVVQFVVKKDGSISDVKVVRSKDPDLDREAVRVVKTFPNFIPGKMNGQAVNVWYTLPINFKLQGE